MQKALSLTALLAVYSSAVSADMITIEPDDYSIGTDLSSVHPFITFQANGGISTVVGPGMGVFAADPSVDPQTLEQYTTSTGSLAFGYAASGGGFGATWREGGPDVPDLQGIFHVAGVREIIIDVIANDPDVGYLAAFDSLDQLIMRVETNPLNANEIETLTLTTSQDIAYFFAGGSTANTAGLDNLRFQVIPAPSTVVPLLVMAALRRRR